MHTSPTPVPAVPANGSVGAAAEESKTAGDAPPSSASGPKLVNKKLPRWPLAEFNSSQSSSLQSYASSIKALNLEPTVVKRNQQPSYPKASLRDGGRPSFLQPLPPLKPRQESPTPVEEQPPKVPAPVAAVTPASPVAPVVPLSAPAAPSPAAPSPMQQQVTPSVPSPVAAQPSPTSMSSPMAASVAPGGGAARKGFKLKNVKLAPPKTLGGAFKSAMDDDDDGVVETPRAHASPEIAAAPEEVAAPPVTPTSPSQALAPVAEPVSPVTAAKPSEPLVVPTNQVFDRTIMMRVWKLQLGQVHSSVKNLSTRPRPEDTKKSDDKWPRKDPLGNKRKDKEDSKRKDKEEKHTLMPSKGGYKPTKPATREDELERRVLALLNKICPDNLKTIVDRLADVELNDAKELEQVITIILGKALSESHYCETYADMVYILRTRYPEFPPEEGEKPATFRRVLLNACQNEFERLPTSLELSPEETKNLVQGEIDLEKKRRKDRLLANMKFIGHLFLRELLAVKVIASVVHDLVGVQNYQDGFPEEHKVECACELLVAIGHTLDDRQDGKVLMSQFIARLMDLKGSYAVGTKNMFYSRRVQFQIQDLTELRQNRWVKKMLREQAKKLDDVRKEAHFQESRGKGQPIFFSSATAGQKPAYIEDLKKSAAKGQGKGGGASGTSRASWSQAHVKRCVQYYAEDRSAEGLEKDWKEPNPSNKEAKEGLGWLLENGADNARQASAVADALSVLCTRRIVSWDVFKQALHPFLERIEDLRMDCPGVDSFLHKLFAAIISGAGKDLPACLFEAFPQGGGASGAITYSLLSGALQLVRAKGGVDAVKRHLDGKDLMTAMSRAKSCTAADLKTMLRKDGAL